MAAENSLRDLVHAATHRMPGVPEHVEHPAGHQGKDNPSPRAGHQGKANPARPARPARHEQSPSPVARTSRTASWNHSPDRRPRVLAAWQRRIGRFFGQEM